MIDREMAAAVPRAEISGESGLARAEIGYLRGAARGFGGSFCMVCVGVERKFRSNSRDELRDARDCQESKSKRAGRGATCWGR